MVLLATIFIVTDKGFITGMSTLMKSEIPLRSEGTIAARKIARVFPVMGDPSDITCVHFRETRVVLLTSAPNVRARGYVGYIEMST